MCVKEITLLEFFCAALVICQPVEATPSLGKNCFPLITLWFRANTLTQTTELLLAYPWWPETPWTQWFIKAEAINIAQLTKRKECVTSQHFK
jgi:hypothetical protein